MEDKKMKKIYTLVFAALCAAVVLSCNKETLVETTADEQTAPVAQSILNPVTLTFETPSPSKVSIDDQGVASWDEGDQVKIICFDAEGQAWTSDPITVVEGKITATVEDAEVYYAVYPAAATIALENVEGVDNLKVTIATKQDGTFKNACYYAAKTTKDAKTFNFKAVSGILKFQADAKYTKAVVRTVEKAAQKCRFDGDALCTFDESGNLSVAPTFDATTATGISLDQSGTYYMAVVGNAKNEFIIQLSDHDNSYPAKFINKPVEFTPAKIKNAGTVNPVTDVYVSVDGTGDGLSEASPANAADLAYKDTDFLGDASKNSTITGLLGFTGGWNCLRRDGLTIHFAEGEYNYESFTTYTIGGTGTEEYNVTLSGAGAGKTQIKNKLTLSGNGETKVEDMTFTGITTPPAIAFSNGIVNFENCVFSSNSATTGNGGAVNVSNSSPVGSLIGFNNCSFKDNKSANSGALFSNGAAYVFFNKCSFSGNSGGTNAQCVYMNAANTNLGINNCTLNLGNFSGSNRSGVATKGHSIIANTTLWSSGTLGAWGSVALGANIASVGRKNASNVVNCAIQNAGTSLYLHASYYQNVNYCLYRGSTDADATKHFINNSVNLPDDYKSKASSSKTVNGVSLAYYTWNFATTTSGTGFTKPTLAQVQDMILHTDESEEGKADGLGKAFIEWLASVDENALTTDILGNDRASAGTCPGSVEQAN